MQENLKTQKKKFRIFLKKIRKNSKNLKEIQKSEILKNLKKKNHLPFKKSEIFGDKNAFCLSVQY